jgi:hypothetical protein
MDRNGAHDPAPTGLPHGAVQAPVFDSRTGAVRHGPATQPLAGTRITERGGDIYALNG